MLKYINVRKSNMEARKLVLDATTALSTGNVVLKPQITNRCTKMKKQINKTTHFGWTKWI
jgi:hypothetical protein